MDGKNENRVDNYSLNDDFEVFEAESVYNTENTKLSFTDYQASQFLKNTLNSIEFPQFYLEAFKIYRTKKFKGRTSFSVKLKGIIYHLLRDQIELKWLEPFRDQQIKILQFTLKNFKSFPVITRPKVEKPKKTNQIGKSLKISSKDLKRFDYDRSL